MTHTEEFKRDDGTKVKIQVKLRVESFTDGYSYDITVSYCPPRKRTWYYAVNTDDDSFRNAKNRGEYCHSKNLEHVSETEIFLAKRALWSKIEPKDERNLKSPWIGSNEEGS